ncbi:helix-turn-helix domain-containing protein [Litoribacter populi]|uniref:helix-turn-helix domain-containing protein n=1 Tax=Litoribacter populi TaxID=2598460 RepID=UPI00117F76C9|nr:helix-turn-helix domain-containing protein [Litoribacter populi]
MQQPDLSNQHFQMAVQFVNQTAQHLFLTGKAGTGKTTFLKYIKASSPKQMVVVAPTGVAAINAGGVTIHSLFQLPFGSFIPGDENLSGMGSNFFNRKSLLQHLRLSRAKRELMQELELLVIDEVSMVRADLLDAMDMVLRHVRKAPYKPFGGIQMLFIGDLFQLPPVVKDTEQRVLSRYYESPMFFHAKALRENPPIYLELKKIYRQSDETFIKLLNNLRNNQPTREDMALLRTFYKPNFKPTTKGEYITLTSHNAKADVINRQELKKLPGRLYEFEAKIEGEFNENALPAEKVLQLKEGAQVMFIRNDNGEKRRFYNGKTGTISSIKGDEIHVVFPHEPGELLVEKQVWENVRYEYDAEKEQVVEELKGSFTQYPLRLAWAITIHKSQGLTFAKAIVDAGESFAAGQVYVALSRLQSLEGLVLQSPIHADCISTDQEALAFANTEPERSDLEERLKVAQKHFVHDSLLQVFSWHKLAEKVEEFHLDLPTRRIPLEEEALRISQGLFLQAVEFQEVGEKFTRQLEQLLPKAEADHYTTIHERVLAATDYFESNLQEKMLQPLKEHIEALKSQPKKAKRHLQELESLLQRLQSKSKKLQQMTQISKGLTQGGQPGELLDQIAAEKLKSSTATNQKPIQKQPFREKRPKGKKPLKGDSMRLSLQLYRVGKSIAEIATERGLVTGTIESHLISFIPTGEVKLDEFVSQDKKESILAVIQEAKEELKSSEIREILGEKYSFAEIRAVMASLPKLVSEG